MNNSAAETELRYKDERLEFERYRSSVRQNVIYIIALVSVIAICGIIYIFYRRNKMQKQRIEEYLTLIEELTYIIHSGFISGYQNRYGDNLKPPTNVYHRMTA